MKIKKLNEGIKGTKVFVVTSRNDVSVYSNKEDAEAKAKQINDFIEMGGGHEGYASVKEVEVQ